MLPTLDMAFPPLTVARPISAARECPTDEWRTEMRTKSLEKRIVERQPIPLTESSMLVALITILIP